MPETKTNVYQALMQAQKDMGPLLKNATNPAFRSKYADLGSVIETITEPLHKNGLVFYQSMHVTDGQLMLQTNIASVETGEIIPSVVAVVSKDPNDPQKMGAAITYMRRYSLMALLGLAPEDDDGNSASTPAKTPSAPTPSKPAYSPAGMGNTTTTEPAGRTFDDNVAYGCEVAGCTDTQDGSFARTCYGKFGKVYCRKHWGMAKSGELEEIPAQQTASAYAGDKEPLPWE